MSIDSKKNFIVKVLYAALIAALIYIAFKWLMPLLLPFILAFAFSMLVRPLTRLLCDKLHLNKKVVGSLLVTLLFVILAALVMLAGFALYSAVQSLAGRFKDDIVPYIYNLFDDIINRLGEWSPQAIPFLSDLRESLLDLLGTKITDFSVASLGSIISAAPGLLIQVLFMIIGTYFIVIDSDTLAHSIECRMSEQRFERLRQYKSHLGKTIGKFLKSYSIIFVITFSELCIALFICGVPRFWFIALLIALFDILPIVGSGTVMIPWGIINLLRGDIGQGVGLLVSWLVILIVRQFVEPRIVGKRVGIHPLLTLMSMFVGLQLFGAFGLIGLPLLLALIVGLEDNGIITIFPKRELEPTVKQEKRAQRKKKKAKQ